MIKRILVAIDNSPHAAAATQRACEIAHAHNAETAGLAVVDTPEIIGQTTPVYPEAAVLAAEASQELVAEAERTVKSALEKYAALCETAHVPHLEIIREGVPADQILRVSRLFDLLVIGVRTFFHFETREGPGDSLTRILRESATPVLAVPRFNPGPFHTVTVVFDGSANAARTLRDFAVFAHPYDFKIKIVSSHRDEDHARQVAEAAAAYLRAHGKTDLTAFGTKHDIVDALEDDVIGATDLIVAGQHHRQPIKDLFKRSVPDYLVKEGHTSLFIG